MTYIPEYKKVEDDLSGRQLHWETTSVEDDLSGKRLYGKRTLVEDEISLKSAKYL